ncbi:MAG TPA: hypothetical protein VMW01_13970 [Williamwhitmania sp.]|nr:hypothetical protein [Williamwhitmania sp.]
MNQKIKVLGLLIFIPFLLVFLVVGIPFTAAKVGTYFGLTIEVSETCQKYTPTDYVFVHGEGDSVISFFATRDFSCFYVFDGNLIKKDFFRTMMGTIFEVPE